MPITMTPGDMKYRDENGVYHDLNYIKGDVIDDSAGVGDTDKTFSADKLTTELSDVKRALDDKSPVIVSTASGAIASFSDGADNLPLKSCVVSIEPVQDLHGQSSPYPAGGGKNLLNYADYSSSYNIASVTDDGNGTFVVVASEYGAYIDHLISVTAGQSYRYKAESVSNDSGNASQMSIASVYDGEDDTATDLINKGSIVNGKNFTPTGNKVLVRCYVTGGSGGGTGTIVKPQLEAGTTTTDYAPYSNICPITGWIGGSVTRRSKNIFEPVVYSGLAYNPEVGTVMTPVRLADNLQPVDNGDGTFTASFGSTTWQYRTFIIPVTAGKNYWRYIRFKQSGNKRISHGALNSDYKVLSVTNVTDSGDITINGAYNPTAAHYYYILLTNRSSKNIDVKIEYPQIEEGTAKTDYAPYNTVNVPISWETEAGTVYGGTLDVVKGKLTVSLIKRMASDITWSDVTNSGVHYFTCTQSYIKEESRRNELYCSAYKTVVSQYLNPSPNKTITNAWARGENINVRDDDIPDLTAWGTYIQQNDFEIVWGYTPIVIDLTPVEIRTLLGVNYIWGTTGNTSVEYPADTKLFIEKLTKPTEDDMIANANISSGKFFMVGNNLYLSTSAIAQGEAIVPGTNCTSVSLSDALNTINQ